MGVLVIDAVKIPNSPIADIKLKFVDGLSLVKDKEYRPTSTTFYQRSEKETLWKHLQNCFKLLPIYDKYLASDDLVTTFLNWEYTDMINTSIFLKATRVPHSLFTTEDDDGNKKALSVWQVIETILRPFFLNISYDPTPNNNYLIRSNRDRLSLSMSGHLSHKPNFATVVPDTESRVNPTDIDVLAGGNFGFLAGLQKVSMDFSYETDKENVNFQTQDTEPSDYQVMANFQVTSADEQIVLYGDIRAFWDIGFRTVWRCWGFFNCYIRVKSATKTVYFARPWQDQTVDNDNFVSLALRELIGWTATEASFGLETEEVKWKRGNHTSHNLFIETTDNIGDEFEVGDEIEVAIKFEILGKFIEVRAPNAFGVLNDNFDIRGYQRKISVGLIRDGESVDTATGLEIVGTINEKNSKKADYDIKLGFGQKTSTSNLEVNTFQGWRISSNKWNKGAGEFYLYELIIREFYAMRKNTIMTYSGRFRGRNIYGNMICQLTHGDQELFYPLRYSHDLRDATISGYFVKPANFLGAPTIEFIRQTGGGGSAGGGTSLITTSGVDPSSQGSPQFNQRPFEVKNITTSSFIIQNITLVREDSSTSNPEMEIYVQLRRNNTPLRYAKDNPTRMEYNVTQSGADVIITLGIAARARDIFTGWIAN